MIAVVIGCNEGERLVRCLTSLNAAGIPAIYVDSGSSDHSVAVAHGLGAAVHPLAMDRPFTAARARAEGIAAMQRSGADPELVFFVDGDCEVEPGWPAAAMTFLWENPGFAAVCGRRRERAPDASPYNRLMDREWAAPAGECAACGGDAVFRLAAYLAVGGFDPAMLAGEEPELCARLRVAGWRVMRLDAPMTLHDAAMIRFSQWWTRAVRSGFGYAQAYQHTRTRGDQALYRTQIVRAVVWAGVLPLGALLLALLLHPVLGLIWPGLAGGQFVRLTAREGAFGARLAMLGKYAELTGLARFVLRRAAAASYR